MTTNDTPMTPRRRALSDKVTMALAAIFVLGGLAALAFWTAMLVSGKWPVASFGEWVLMAVILGFPVMGVVSGLWILASPMPGRGAAQRGLRPDRGGAH